MSAARVDLPYTEIAPPADLSPYVDRFWLRTTLTGNPAAVDRVLPDGCVDVIVHVGRGVAELVGTMTRALVLPQRPAELVAVRFKPGTARAVVGESLAALTDRRAGVAVLGIAEDALVERIADAATPHGRVAVLVGWLRSRLAGAERPDALVARGIALVSGTARIEHVARALNVSRQHLARRFACEVGLSPKQLARIARMQRTAAAIAHGASLARLAAEHGYFDQAHLASELRALIGVAPSALAGQPAMALAHLYGGSNSPSRRTRGDLESPP